MTTSEHAVVEVIEQFYRAISGSADDAPNRQILASLFAPDASILSVRGEDSSARSADSYINHLVSVLGRRGFYERGQDYEVRVHQDIAQVWSRYEASATAEYEVTIKTGTNLILLVRTRENWKIAAMLYEDDA